MDDGVIGVEGFVSFCESFELSDEIDNGRLLVLLGAHSMSPANVFPSLSQTMADDFVVFVVRDQHPLLLGGVLEMDFVSRALREDIFGAHDFPAVAVKCFDETAVNAFVHL